MDIDVKIKELEKSLEDLRRRWPAHSVKPQMIEEMERLEDEIERLKASIIRPVKQGGE